VQVLGSLIPVGPCVGELKATPGLLKRPLHTRVVLSEEILHFQAA